MSDARIPGVEGGRGVTITLDGAEIAAREGESLAAALLSAGRRATRSTAVSGEPRGVFCGIGLCQDCLMTVDGQPNVRACATPVRDGMRAERQRGLGEWGVEA